MYKVIHGTKHARTLGFPTANIKYNLADSGIFMGFTTYNNVKYKSLLYKQPMSNILESHLFSFNETIYDKYIDVEIICKLREFKQFDNLDSLIYEINYDAFVCLFLHEAYEYLRKIKSGFVIFDGDKESSMIIHMIHLLKLNNNWDIIHFKPIYNSLSEEQMTYMANCTSSYGFTFNINEYTNIELCLEKYNNVYDACLLGNINKKYINCNQIYEIYVPFNEFSYKNIWKYIEYFNIQVSPLYSKGYLKVGYNAKPSILLKRFDNKEYTHAKMLKSIEFIK